MKTKLLIWVLVAFTSIACEPKKVEPANVGKVWKAQTVKENGTLVYTEGNVNNMRPGYSMFRLDLTSADKVTFMDLDGRKLTGKWSLSTDNNLSLIHI